MKKRLLRALACALLAAVIALPGALALEKANTQKELTYGGIEWYIDYGTLADTLAGTALDSGSIDREDNFGSGSFYAPDWISVLTGTTYISDGDKDCGGSLKLDTHRAKLSVAKHELLEAEFYFITGADAINELSTWHEAQHLLEICHFIAATRQGCALDLPRLRREFDEGLVAEHIHELPTPELEISSTDIRRRVQEGRSIKYLVTAEVEAYIYKEGLYS